MDAWLIAVALLGCILLALACLLALEHMLIDGKGRVVVFVAALVLPVAMSTAGIVRGVQRSSNTEFCVSCHEMQVYGRSLFVDNSEALSAAHYQQRLIPRKDTCYACHTDYAMFGDVSAKLNGLLHVWVHYTGAPEKIELYKPYPNYNCLHCHDDARGFMEVTEHGEELKALRAEEKSCLECHEIGHDLEGVKAGNFWKAAVEP